MKFKTTIYTFFVIIVLLSQPVLSYSQEQRFEFNVGFGPFLDAVHTGINFQIGNKFDVGINVGSIPNKWDFGKHINTGGEIKYKFGQSKYIKARQEINGKYKKVPLKTWYYGFRLNFVKNLETRQTEKKIHLYYSSNRKTFQF